MPLEAPNLDDRRFADLVEEAKSLIPRYTPEWTDHNLSDPGITMIQLFAWLGDVLLYRLNRVPERQYIKFLELIGVDRKPAVPASAEVTFTLSGDIGSVVIPKGTRIGTEGTAATPSAVSPSILPQEEEEQIVFETDEPIVAIGAALARVQVFDSLVYVDRTTANDPSTEQYHPFGPQARPGSALLLGFSSANLFPTDELNIMVRVYDDPELAEAYTCPAGEEVSPSATIQWEYWNGKSWSKLSVLKDETAALTLSGHIYFRGPKDIARATVGSVTDEELYWIRGRLLSSQYEIAPQLEAVLTNTVRVTAITTVEDEVVGSSNGSPDQTFVLRNAPIHADDPRSTEERLLDKKKQGSTPPTEGEQAELDAALEEREYAKGFWLEVDEAGATHPWEEVEDFYTSGPDDRHYTLNRSSATVTFGNGKQGRIPIAGINNIVVRYYRHGGGASGNVGSGTITDLQTPVTGVDSVTNHWGAEGGSDEEAIEDTKSRAPKELKARDRAVTAEDYEFIAKQTPGVRIRRAHALPLHHPLYDAVEVPGVVTVIVIPESEDPKPVPSEGTMKTVCAYLKERRLLTTEVYVAPPKYKLVKVEASVVAKSTSNGAEVKTNVESALATYLHPLTGGADGQGWPLGGSILYSEIFRTVLQVEGVQIVEEITIIIDDEPIDPCTNAEIPSDHLVYSDGHDVSVSF